MSPVEILKAEAAALQAKEKALGHLMKHCDALEQVAKRHGYESWRACRAVLAADPPAVASPPAEKIEVNFTEMKRYESSEWNFALDIPKRWNSFPPVPSNSQYEVIRFRSHEDGIHLLIVFRMPHNNQKSREEIFGNVKESLARKGFGNFVTNKTTIGSREALMLDFDKPQGAGIWSCRHYFIPEDTLEYTLGFGTNNKASMFELYDRMAKSFEIIAKLPPSSPAAGP
jgi:hypothetical protein